ncbi:hypothetical protein TBLA_0H02290 [Henningerozyma blattae CBS 6284]|uniref:Calcium-channel protein CCH1 n=1 Tax=Henningerozyma blattae (strain ATCC 34711 / CBS 6284 / DSM 70876 / NBRC 10599 / NRRL Y-10934 / UCD 77-7) TaxID=1071380 RepID=I2H812_HENB6|nr:hypothetical protein TBLA_0H02290 [Tetrapisispora blattae CBS 6284]CCH62514.1 hypothetical protein TBLA_0H02290 [Tetrapisispora blattae CBS 6284]
MSSTNKRHSTEGPRDIDDVLSSDSSFSDNITIPVSRTPKVGFNPFLNVIPSESSLERYEEKHIETDADNDSLPSNNNTTNQQEDNSRIQQNENSPRKRVERKLEAASFGNLFKLKDTNRKNRAHPTLSLNTTFQTNHDKQDKNPKQKDKLTVISATGVSFNLSPATEGFRRRPRNSDASNQSNQESASSSSPFMAPRSAKVLSFIAPDDMDEFHDLQKEFQIAVDDEGLSWLPQVKIVADKKLDTKNTTTELPTIIMDDTLVSSEEAPTSHNQLSPSVTSFNVSPRINRNAISPDSYELESVNIRSNSNLSFPHYNPLASNDKVKDKNNKTLEVIDLIDSESAASFSTEVEVAEPPDIPDFGELFTKTQAKTLRLYGHSLRFISAKNIIRIKFANLHTNSIYIACYFVFLILFIAYLGVRTFDPINFEFIYGFSFWEDYACFLILVYFTLHDLSKIIAFGLWDDSQMFDAYGVNYKTIAYRLRLIKVFRVLREKYHIDLLEKISFIKNYLDDEETRYARRTLKASVTDIKSKKYKKDFDCPRAFLRSSWNRIDLISTICFWLGLFVSFGEYYKVRIFAPFAVLRIVRIVDADNGITSILRGLKYGFPQLLSTGSVLLYFWVFFSILGVQVFQGSLRRQCVWINPSDPHDTFQYSMQFCGGYLDPITKKKRNYVYKDGTEGPLAKGFICPVNSKCISNANPYNGRVSFDNIINAMELVFVVMSANTFTDIMYYTMDSDELSACLFFICAIFVMTIWLLNLVVAVLVSSFDLANEKFKKEKIGSSKKDNRIFDLVNGYWKYFLVKAKQSTLPNWSQSLLRLYANLEWFFVGSIMVDLIARSSIKASSPEVFMSKFFKIDLAISIVLFIETIFRVICYIPNLWKFLIVPSFLFDLVLSVVTLIISILATTGMRDQTYYWLSVFHISRFYRVIKSFQITKNIWLDVLKNWVMIWNLSVFYFLFTFLVSLILSVYFEGVIPESADQQLSMSSLPNTYLSLFTIASTENWTTILYNLQTYAPNISSAVFSSVFLILWFILAYFVIINIFVALISESMSVDESEKRPLQIQHYLKYIYPKKIKEYRHASLVKRIMKLIFRDDSEDDPQDFKQFLMRGTAIMSISQTMGDAMKDMPRNLAVKSPLIGVINELSGIFPFLKNSWLKSHNDNPFFNKPTVLFTEITENNEKSYMLQLNDYEDEKLEYLKSHPFYNYSYLIIPPNHKVRKFCQRFVAPSVGRRTDGYQFFDDETDMYTGRKYFKHIERDFFIMFYAVLTVLLIILSCYVTPLYRLTHQYDVWDWSTACDLSMVVLFTIEFLIKTIADGFVFTPNAYLRNPWNFIDFMVLVSMWITFVSFIAGEGDLARIFKGLTAMRALRCLTISDTARSTFSMVVFDGLSVILKAAFVAATFLYPFTVWGLTLFKGRLGKCNDSNMDKMNCYGEFTNTVFQWDIMMPRTYSQPYLYLDEFSSAMKTMYEIVSLEGWVDLLENLINSTGVGTIPKDGASNQNATFLIFFNFLSMIFILNLFVSFIIDNHARTTGSAYYTVEEKSWLESKKLLSQAKPKATPNLFKMSKFRLFFYRLAIEKNNLIYSICFEIILYLHILMLIIQHYERDSIKTTSEGYFTFSTIIFFLHEIFCIIGEGIKIRFKSRWNITRVIIVLVSFALLVGIPSVSKYNYWYKNIANTFHLLIFLFVIPENDTLYELLETAMASIPSIVSLSYTWAILFLIYSIATNQVFGLTKIGPNTSHNINFRTIFKSMLALFKFSFGEGWNYIMDDLTLEEPYCSFVDGMNETDCGSKIYAYLFLMSWNIVSMYIFVNMFVSLIVSNFSYVYRRSNSETYITRSEIQKFVDTWSKFDSDGSGDLEFSKLPTLMHSDDGLLFFKVWEGSLSIKNLVEKYIEVNPDDPYDVTVKLHALNNELNSIEVEKLKRKIFQYKRFIREVHYSNAYRGGMKFSRVLQLIPLYTIYNPRECLNIDEYVRHLYLRNKVERYLANEKTTDVLKMVVVRWKFLQRRKHKIRNISQSSFPDPISESTSNKATQFTNETGPQHNAAVSQEFDYTKPEIPNIVTTRNSTPDEAYGVNYFFWSPDRR